jgi:hypothetical protein
MPIQKSKSDNRPTRWLDVLSLRLAKEPRKFADHAEPGFFSSSLGS